MSGECYTAKKIAEAIGKSVRWVNLRAKKEGWKAKVLNGRGDKTFYLEGLPAEIKIKMIQRESIYIDGMILPARSDLDLGQARALLAKFENAPAWSRRRAEARGAIVEAFEVYCSALKAQRQLTKGKADFIRCYNSGNNHLGISPGTYETIDMISRGSLDRWRANKKMFGLAGLLDASREKQQFCGLNDEQKKYIINLKVEKIHRRPARICEYIRNRFTGQDLPSNATIRRFIKIWEKDNAEYVEFLRNPDKWRSEYQAAFGDAGEKALYYLHMLEFDNSPADVMCSDGKRYTICGAIDIFSRKVQVIVVPTSKSQAVANLMRRVILDWGLFDVMIKDNGQDYASHHINMACKALHIEAPVLPKFSPELKPHIERFFRTMTEGLFEELDGFTGHNVAQAQDLRAAKSFSERMFKQGEAIQCSLTAEDLQARIDDWIRNVYHQREHGSLGKSPEQRAGENVRPVRRIMDERVLDILLAPAGKATVSKKGIRYESGLYAAVELADWIGQKVQRRRDMADAATLYVFDQEFKFICIAKDQALEGLSVEELNIARARQKKRVREAARAMKALAKEVGDPMTELLDAKAKGNGQVFGFQRHMEFESDEVQQASKALAPPDQPSLMSFDAHELWRGEQTTDDPSEMAATGDFHGASKVVQLHDEEPWFETGKDRCKYLMQQEKIRTLTATERAWLEGYQATEEYYRIFVMPYE